MNPPVPFHRRPLFVIGALAVALGLGVVAWHHHAGHDHGHDHSHHHHAGHRAADALSLDDGKPWATDEALRTGMARIRDAAAPALAAHAKGQLSREAATQLSTAIQEHVGFLMRNCKLSPKADATLHVFITRLIEGAAQLAADPKSAEGAAKLGDALRDYPRYFNHPAWSAP